MAILTRAAARKARESLQSEESSSPDTLVSVLSRGRKTKKSAKSVSFELPQLDETPVESSIGSITAKRGTRRTRQTRLNEESQTESISAEAVKPALKGSQSPSKRSSREISAENDTPDKEFAAQANNFPNDVSKPATKCRSRAKSASPVKLSASTPRRTTRNSSPTKKTTKSVSRVIDPSESKDPIEARSLTREQSNTEIEYLAEPSPIKGASVKPITNSSSAKLEYSPARQTTNAHLCLEKNLSSVSKTNSKAESFIDSPNAEVRQVPSPVFISQASANCSSSHKNDRNTPQLSPNRPPMPSYRSPCQIVASPVSRPILSPIRSHALKPLSSPEDRRLSMLQRQTMLKRQNSNSDLSIVKEHADKKRRTETTNPGPIRVSKGQSRTLTKPKPFTFQTEALAEKRAQASQPPSAPAHTRTPSATLTRPKARSYIRPKPRLASRSNTRSPHNHKSQHNSLSNEAPSTSIKRALEELRSVCAVTDLKPEADLKYPELPSQTSERCLPEKENVQLSSPLLPNENRDIPPSTSSATLMQQTIPSPLQAIKSLQNSPEKLYSRVSVSPTRVALAKSVSSSPIKMASNGQEFGFGRSSMISNLRMNSEAAGLAAVANWAATHNLNKS
ncbi:hypothetical protein CANCADRAFT_132865 [Tortispora caseinolytica NRRL Y-17796]|uniref:Uncharacterized protein n=1 Tax=Tortispora caseinolytica NRRL Y-17796 TaxID=767744 RepID=A0A1E4TB87_9ASCO|nr:hypothetical protein CANCADRAFT_132865 [Tortispora caseinolytica NRRL Y-17796]